MRTLTTPFLNQIAKRSSKPYFVLQIDWYVNSEAYEATNYIRTRYYLDRESTQFDNPGAARCPTAADGLGPAKVVDWGSIKLTLREGQVGAVDDVTIRIEDGTGEIRSFLDESIQQREVVKIWRMWDDPSVTWEDDKLLVFAGAIRPYSWSESDNTITIPLEDISKRLAAEVGLRVTKGIWHNAPRESLGKVIPTVFGMAERVEAVLISAPWETRTAAPVPSATSVPFTLDITDHPDEVGMGVEYPTGTEVSPIDLWIGGERASGYVAESGDPDTTPSTIVVTGYTSTGSASATITQCSGFGGARKGIIQAETILPGGLYDTLADRYPAGTDVEVLIDGTWTADTIASINANTPVEGMYEIGLATNSASLSAVSTSGS